ncbi:hypothetical protein M422DRAFT_247762 [Sphaerobolus stellatus SS14]|nr:hypothetical protein M422DRAFT_247762 [Sphaerobolus stellatus SS14]
MSSISVINQIRQFLKEGDNCSKVFLATKFGHLFDEETEKLAGEVRVRSKRFEKLRKEGKIKRIGFSEHSVETLNIVAKDALLATARELGVILVVYNSLGRGFLTGPFESLSDLEASDARSSLPKFHEKNFIRNLLFIEIIQAIADKKGVTPA